MTYDEFSEKLSAYKDTVLRIAFAYCRNMSDAQDISQDVFLKLYTKAPDFSDSHQEKAWIIRVTINMCKNLLKLHFYSRREDLEENIPDKPQFRESELDLLQAVFKLPDKYRLVIHLYYYEDYSVSEISIATGRKISTVQTQLDRARRMLKKILVKENPYETTVQTNI
ncbi:MAG: sigma-70 family RNA polymerase sigma factor [Oscillospiraceae bacterium]|nr:sigma-70 family RNA polymerase sigma factor [Oscillospiraceae bacterium]